MWKKIRYFIEYVPVLCLDTIFRSMPRQWAYWFGEVSGQIVRWILWSRNKLIIANLEQAFPELSRVEIRGVARGVWRNLGRIIVEFVRMGSINRENFDEHFVFDDHLVLDQVEALKKGLIVIGFHFTNWELNGVGCKWLIKGFLAIARPVKNPWVQRWVEKKRADGKMEIILHRQAVKASLRALQQKKAVGILVDQNLYTGGIFVDFFGRPAATTTLPAILHVRTGAPVVLTYGFREHGKFRQVIEKIETERLLLESDPIRAITQAISSRIEAVIRQKPENWFWIHNRWKRRPEGA